MEVKFYYHMALVEHPSRPGLQFLAFYLLLIIPFLVRLVIFDRLVGVRICHDVESNELALARAIALETDSQ